MAVVVAMAGTIRPASNLVLYLSTASIEYIEALRFWRWGREKRGREGDSRSREDGKKRGRGRREGEEGGRLRKVEGREKEGRGRKGDRRS